MVRAFAGDSTMTRRPSTVGGQHGLVRVPQRLLTGRLRARRQRRLPICRSAWSMMLGAGALGAGRSGRLSRRWRRRAADRLVGSGIREDRTGPDRPEVEASRRPGTCWCPGRSFADEVDEPGQPAAPDQTVRRAVGAWSEEDTRHADLGQGGADRGPPFGGARRHAQPEPEAVRRAAALDRSGRRPPTTTAGAVEVQRRRARRASPRGSSGGRSAAAGRRSGCAPRRRRDGPGSARGGTGRAGRARQPGLQRPTRHGSSTSTEMRAASGWAPGPRTTCPVPQSRPSRSSSRGGATIGGQQRQLPRRLRRRRRGGSRPRRADEGADSCDTAVAPDEADPWVPPRPRCAGCSRRSTPGVPPRRGAAPGPRYQAPRPVVSRSVRP